MAMNMSYDYWGSCAIMRFENHDADHPVDFEEDWLGYSVQNIMDNLFKR